jgi:hypothetical protein
MRGFFFYKLPTYKDMKEITVQSEFWNSPKRVVLHNESDNTIHVNGHVFTWNNFFQVNRIV